MSQPVLRPGYHLHPRFLLLSVLVALAISVKSVFAFTTRRYKHGPGDRQAVKLFQVEGFDSNAAVLPDGTINLPRIGSQQVWGLTLDQARELITGAYMKVLRRPEAYLNLVATRPLRVANSSQLELCTHLYYRPSGGCRRHQPSRQSKHNRAASTGAQRHGGTACAFLQARLKPWGYQ